MSLTDAAKRPLSTENASPARQEATAAVYIAETFKACGLTHVFFMESTLRKTLVEMESLGVTRVLAHSEAAAVYMADGYARIARRPGLCMAQSVGAANMAAALQDPFLGCSPVIALTGKKTSNAQHRHAYQEIDHRPIFEPVTKFNVAVETTEQLPRLLRQALREATTGVPGPVHLDLAGGFAGEAIEAGIVQAPIGLERCFSRYPALRPAPEHAALVQAARLLEAAERPILVAGGGARASNAGADILRLAEKFQIPVATSLNAKGIIRETHPLAVGVVGTYSRRPANQAVHAADLVVFIGSHTGDQVTNNWTIPEPTIPIIQIDIDPRELGRSYSNAVSIAADAQAAVAGLIGVLRPGTRKDGWARHCAELVRQWHQEYAELCESNAAPIRPERLCREIERTLPDDAILVSDTGYSGIWSGALIEIDKSGQDYLRAAGSLGWGFPASLGAKCAAPDRPVVCFTGDGGFWYHLSELETACRCGINTVTIINNNSGFSQCIDGVARGYGNRPGRQSDLYSFRDTNFAAIAAEIGCHAERVEDPGAIDAAIQSALRTGRPAVIDVVTDPAARAPAPWTPPSA
jgi:acetolactate synthase-1/2/3 large subunit